MLRAVAPGLHAADHSVLRLGGIERCFEQQSDVRLAHDFVVEQQVPQLPAPLRIVGRVVEANLFEQSAFAPTRTAFVIIRADDVHLDLARRIAAEPRTILHQHDLRSVPGRAQRRQHARQSAARDHHIAMQIHDGHIAFERRGGAIARRRDAFEVAPDLIGIAVLLSRQPVNLNEY